MKLLESKIMNSLISQSDMSALSVALKLVDAWDKYVCVCVYVYEGNWTCGI